MPVFPVEGVEIRVMKVVLALSLLDLYLTFVLKLRQDSNDLTLADM